MPLTRTEPYATTFPYQTEASIHIYQGDDDDALKNVLVGDFRVEGLTPLPEPNAILCRMRLDLDGILQVTAVEKRTGHSRHITIENALRARTAAEIAAGRQRIRELYESRQDALEEEWSDPIDGPDAAIDEMTEGATDPQPPVTPRHDDAIALLARSRGVLDRMHPDDREEAIELHDRIDAAMAADDAPAIQEATRVLKELLFFVEGQV